MLVSSSTRVRGADPHVEIDNAAVADMVFSIDIPLFKPWGGLRVEDGFLVTATGAEPLQSIAKDIRHLS